LLLTTEEVDRAASTAKYCGSPEHKFPHAKSDATLCPSELGGELPQLTEWLRLAIKAGQVGGLLEGDFPRYVWHQEGNQWFEGRLTNRTLGEYKGYPIDQEELPAQLSRMNV
jgi:hypothetical protein